MTRPSRCCRGDVDVALKEVMSSDVRKLGQYGSQDIAKVPVGLDSSRSVVRKLGVVHEPTSVSPLRLLHCFHAAIIPALFENEEIPKSDL